MKFLIMVCATIGLTAGNYLPLLWGGSSLSLPAVLLSGLGGITGIWFGYKMGIRLGM
jgi:hypothetical protein